MDQHLLVFKVIGDFLDGDVFVVDHFFQDALLDGVGVRVDGVEEVDVLVVRGCFVGRAWFGGLWGEFEAFFFSEFLEVVVLVYFWLVGRFFMGFKQCLGVYRGC